MVILFWSNCFDFDTLIHFKQVSINLVKKRCWEYSIILKYLLLQKQEAHNRKPPFG